MVHLLDCTLRDGGYVNDWRFGEGPIRDMIYKLEQAKIDILEVGFLKNEPYEKERTVFNRAGQISPLLGKQNSAVRYAAMAEVINPLPLEMLENAENTDLDMIRVIVWKRMLKEGYEYCKGIVAKGYQLCVQPARVDQYSDEEFVQMVRLFSQLNPFAIYVVDSWGTQTSAKLMHYMELADQNMGNGVCLGYHGHNNMMQAFQVAVDFIHAGFQRDLIVDASIYGIGRGAGNLNMELIAYYLNQELGRDYKIAPLIEIYSSYLKNLYCKYTWGFTMAYFITAIYNCNPNFGSYYEKEKNLAAVDIDAIIQSIPKEERIIYTEEKAIQYANIYFQGKGEPERIIDGNHFKRT